MQLTSPSRSVPVPTLDRENQVALGIRSTLQALPLYQFTITDSCSLQGVMDRFVQFPDLPGVIISGIGGDRLLSRQQLLECLLHGGQISSAESVQRILHYANHKALVLTNSMPILSGAKQALKRPLEQQNDPVLVQSDSGSVRLLDARTLNVAHWQIRGIETQFRYERLQMQLLQSEKMAALGRLVDGVAHEILDPVGFIWGNLSHIASYTKSQSELLAAYEAALPVPPEQIVQLAETIERDYLRSDLPAAIKSAQGGAYRLKQLAISLQNFCHIDEIHPRPTDINALLDSTLRLLKSRISTPIAIQCDYGKLPPIPCYAGQLSQVFMTILTDTIDSLLAQSSQSDYTPGTAHSSLQLASEKPLLSITTSICGTNCQLASAQADPNSATAEVRWVSIIISDNGPGLSPESKEDILNSFSTRSRSRKETGLALSYQIVTAKHGGRFLMRSCHATDSTQPNISNNEISTGTEFEILLPLISNEA